MIILSVEANNYRTLEKTVIKFGRNYCTLSGKNNAGKSAIIKIIQFFFSNRDEERVFFEGDPKINYTRDKTQWSSSEQIEVSTEFEIFRDDDSEVFFVLERFGTESSTSESKGIDGASVIVRLTFTLKSDRSSSMRCWVGDFEVSDERNISEIVKKLRSVQNLFVHNSTSPQRRFYYNNENMLEVLEPNFSETDQRKILEAERNLQAKIKKAARQHKEELQKLLGRLQEKYQVELSAVDRGRSARVPLEIKLTDRSAEVPLTDWGSGTQNRTRVLMAALDAVRIREKVAAKDRSIPVLVVEEPESFLHPSAQAEFGQVLNGLAQELRIQIIATTHSPYMLNQSDPTSNILLERRIVKGLPKETCVRETAAENWMLPFSECLGIVPAEFESWRPIFSAHASKVILVEGQIDKEYFEHIRASYPAIYQLDPGIEILPYGGVAALKNTQILQFMIKKFGRVFVTFDLDAEDEVSPPLSRIGLVAGKDFLPIGISKPGQTCIEGLLPVALKQSVYAQHPDIMDALMAADTKAKSSAKATLKQELLKEFRSVKQTESDLSEFKRVFSAIAAQFSVK